MKVFCTGLHPINPNILGQIGIQSQPQLLLRNRMHQIERRDLPSRMNPGIRAAGALDSGSFME